MTSKKVKIVGVFFLIIILSVFLVSCDLFEEDSIAPEEYSNYEIIIEVVDELTESGVEEATLSIENVKGEYIYAKETDENGLYIFENVELEDNEEFSIIINKEGYISKEVKAVADDDPIKLTQEDAVEISRADFEGAIKIDGPDYITKGEGATFQVKIDNEKASDFPVVVKENVKYTDKNGEVTFHPDKIGSFRARSGLENSLAGKLFWVFPETNRDIEINSLRYHPDHPRHSFFNKGLTGANSITLKAYYTFDEQGEITPIIQGGQGLHWHEVSHKIQQEYLKYQMNKVRDWGFEKIYIHNEILSPDYLGWGDTDKVKNLPESAQQNYLDNVEEEAITLAKFARNKDVDILVPFEHELGWEEIERYKDNLDELRNIYDGKLGVKMTGDAHIISDSFYRQEEPEIKEDLTKFDVIFPIAKLDIPDMSLLDDSITQSQPPTPSEAEQAAQNFLDFYKGIGDKYEARIMPQWIADFGFEPGISDQFIDQFANNAEAVTWLYETILGEIKDKGLYGASAYKTQYTRPRHEIDYIQDTRLYETVASYFSQEREINFVDRDHHKSQHEIMLSENNEDEGDNSLGININGDPMDWRKVDPVYYNPSSTFPNYFIDWYYQGIINDFKPERLNLKAIYALNDDENLYIMIDFYEEAIDVEELKNKGYDIEIQLDIEGNAEWNYWIDLLPTKGRMSNGEKVTEFPFSDGEVYELKIPLQALGYPEEITLHRTFMSSSGNDDEGMLDNWAKGLEIPIIDIDDIVE